MRATLVDIENGAGIGGQLGERETMRWVILGGSVTHNPITPFRADQHQIGRSGLRTALGATGDMNRPGETEPRQQRRKPAPIAACVQRGRLTTRRTRTGFDLEQWVAWIGNEALTLCGSENVLSRLAAGYPGVYRTPRRKPDFLDALGRDHLGKLAKLIGFDAAKGRCDSDRKSFAEFNQTDAAIERCVSLPRIFVQAVEPGLHR